MHLAKAAAVAIGLLALGAPPAMAGTGTSEFWLIAFAGGGINKASGVTSSTRINTGQYIITFPRPVDTCMYLVNLQGAPFGSSTVAKAADPSQLNVRTSNTSGSTLDHAFNLLVRCQD